MINPSVASAKYQPVSINHATNLNLKVRTTSASSVRTKREQRTNNARAAYEQRASSVRTTREQRTRTRTNNARTRTNNECELVRTTNNEPGISNGIGQSARFQTCFSSLKINSSNCGCEQRTNNARTTREQRANDARDAPLWFFCSSL